MAAAEVELEALKVKAADSEAQATAQAAKVTELEETVKRLESELATAKEAVSSAESGAEAIEAVKSEVNGCLASCYTKSLTRIHSSQRQRNRARHKQVRSSNFSQERRRLKTL